MNTHPVLVRVEKQPRAHAAPLDAHLPAVPPVHPDRLNLRTVRSSSSPGRAGRCGAGGADLQIEHAHTDLAAVERPWRGARAARRGARGARGAPGAGRARLRSICGARLRSSCHGGRVCASAGGRRGRARAPRVRDCCGLRGGRRLASRGSREHGASSAGHPGAVEFRCTSEVQVHVYGRAHGAGVADAPGSAQAHARCARAQARGGPRVVG